MASNTNPSVKKATAGTQTIDSFDSLLKTDNIFLFIPNIIGKMIPFIEIYDLFCII